MYGDTWTEFVKPFHVRAQQIDRLTLGMQVGFGVLDRNFCDCLYYMEQEGIISETQPCPAAQIFNRSNCYFGVYQQTQGLQGNLFVGSDNENVTWSDQDVTALEVECGAGGPFLPLEDCEIEEETLIAQNVRVGWRGPMIMELLLPIIPDVFLNEPLLRMTSAIAA